jgi:hypothetical protein
VSYTVLCGPVLTMLLPRRRCYLFITPLQHSSVRFCVARSFIVRSTGYDSPPPKPVIVYTIHSIYDSVIAYAIHQSTILTTHTLLHTHTHAHTCFAIHLFACDFRFGSLRLLQLSSCPTIVDLTHLSLCFSSK